MTAGHSGFSGTYFDGDHPVACEVDLQIANGSLQIAFDDGNAISWPVGVVRKLPDVAGRVEAVLRPTTDALTRLIVHDKSLLTHLPKLDRRSPPKGRARLAIWTFAAITAVVLQIGWFVPLLADRLAGFIPVQGERALGEATFDQIRSALDDTGLSPLPTCDAPAGKAALEQMATALGQGADGEPVATIFVLDHDMVNAFALPGGLVVLFRGLIEAATTPEEVAAVMAHEMGHVASRDPTRHALRSAGSIGVLGLLFGDFAGGAAVLFLTERLISAQYSQAAETGADRFAYERLAKANVSPAALADMFENMRKEVGDTDGVVAHFLSHPTLVQRIAEARAAEREDVAYSPILSDEDWVNLQTICD